MKSFFQYFFHLAESLWNVYLVVDFEGIQKSFSLDVTSEDSHMGYIGLGKVIRGKTGNGKLCIGARDESVQANHITYSYDDATIKIGDTVRSISEYSCVCIFSNVNTDGAPIDLHIWWSHH